MLGLKLNHVSKRGHSKHYVDKYQVRIVSLLSSYLCFLILVLTVWRHQNGWRDLEKLHAHYSDVIMGAMASQITSLTSIYSTVYSGADQGKHQSSAPLAFVLRIHRWPVNSQHKWPVTRKMFPFDDVFMSLRLSRHSHSIWRLET